MAGHDCTLVIGVRHHVRVTRRYLRDDGARAMVAGIDGCRGGWVIAIAIADPFEVVSINTEPDLGGLLEQIEGGELERLAIDMCIGLAEAATRACDVEARVVLGSRRSSVFPAPVRPTLEADSHESANAISRAVSGRGMSIQTWNILGKIRQVDALITPELQDRITEAHPEVAFARLNGAPAAHHKATVSGRSEREVVIGPRLPTPRGAAPDDVGDAMILARTAADWHRGSVWCLGDGERDARGLEMVIRG